MMLTFIIVVLVKQMIWRKHGKLCRKTLHLFCFSQLQLYYIYIRHENFSLFVLCSDLEGVFGFVDKVIIFLSTDFQLL